MLTSGGSGGPVADSGDAYVVQSGDSLSKIASRLGVSARALQDLNGITQSQSNLRRPETESPGIILQSSRANGVLGTFPFRLRVSAGLLRHSNSPRETALMKRPSMNFLHTLTSIAATGAGPTTGDALRRVAESSAFRSIHLRRPAHSLGHDLGGCRQENPRSTQREASRQQFPAALYGNQRRYPHPLPGKASSPAIVPSRIFIAAYEELRLWTTVDQQTGELVSEKPIGPAVQRTLDRAIDAERSEWEWGVTLFGHDRAHFAAVGAARNGLGRLLHIRGHRCRGIAKFERRRAGHVRSAVDDDRRPARGGGPPWVAHNAVVRRVNAIEQELEHFSGQVLNSFERQVRSVDDIRAFGSTRKSSGPKLKGGS